MEHIKLYFELQSDIELLKCKLKDLEHEYEYLRSNLFLNAPTTPGAIEYDKDRVVGGQVPYKMEEWTKKYDQLVDKKDKIQKLIDDKTNILLDSKVIMQNMNSLQRKVAFLKYVENKSLKEIAVELGYSYDHIRRTNSKFKNATK